MLFQDLLGHLDSQGPMDCQVFQVQQNETVRGVPSKRTHRHFVNVIFIICLQVRLVNMDSRVNMDQEERKEKWENKA